MSEELGASAAQTGLSSVGSSPQAVSPADAASIPSADEVDGDLSWFMIAVGRRKGHGYRDIVILDYSDGWSGFDVEFYWEDTFASNPPEHLAPGAYRWTDFNVGFWGEDDAMNVTGGKFEPYTAQAMETRRAETERLGAQHDSAVPKECAPPES